MLSEQSFLQAHQWTTSLVKQACQQYDPRVRDDTARSVMRILTGKADAFDAALSIQMLQVPHP